MGDISKIEWCDSTFNPWVGCTKVSPACDHCYAESWAKRGGNPELWQGERRRTKTWGNPIKWQRQAEAFFAEHGRRRRVFCASLADVFDNQVPVDWRADLWRLISMCPDLDWLLLSKRPQNMAKMLPFDWAHAVGGVPWPWPNVWLGVTAENQDEADRRIPVLLSVPAAIRFVSYEPALGPLELGPIVRAALFEGRLCNDGHVRPIDGVFAGGESGPGARPSHPDWFRSIRDECAAAGVAFLFKQWGEWAPTEPRHIPTVVERQLFIGVDGTHTANTAVVERDDSRRSANRYKLMLRVGKKRAGRLLDGIEHNGFPDGA